MMRGLCCVFLTLFITINAGVYDKYYQEALTIAEGMTLDQKIGQTIQLDFYAMSSVNGTIGSEAVKYNLGSILMGAIGCPNDDGNCIMFDGMTEDQVKDSYANATTDKWQKLANKFKYTVDVTTKDGKTYKIKPLLATDAVHGDQHVAGSILFPHNIGISCSHNENHFFNLGHWVQKSLKQYGFNYAFAPTVAASHNPQWGRFYETMGQDHDQIYKYAKSFTEGLQGKPN
jgi:beta-glucosidase